jgi:hypothetical protein
MNTLEKMGMQQREPAKLSPAEQQLLKELIAESCRPSPYFSSGREYVVQAPPKKPVTPEEREAFAARLQYNNRVFTNCYSPAMMRNAQRLIEKRRSA